MRLAALLVIWSLHLRTSRAYGRKIITMHMYAVGQPLNPEIRQWDEGTHYNFRSSGHELVISFRQPQRAEVQAVKEGDAKFALVVKDDLIVLVFKFGSQPWSDAPYTWHRVKKDERVLPDLPREHERAALTTFMINADGGFILAMRYMTFSSDFTAKLHQAIRDQAQQSFDQVRYDRQLRRLYSQYQSHELVKIAIARCSGGD